MHGSAGQYIFSVCWGLHAQDDRDAPEVSASAAVDSNGKRRLMSRAVAVTAPLSHREEGEVRDARFSRDVKHEGDEHAGLRGSGGARAPDGSEYEVRFG